MKDNTEFLCDCISLTPQISYGKTVGLGFQCLHDSALPLASYVTKGKAFKFSTPQIPLGKIQIFMSVGYHEN